MGEISSPNGLISALQAQLEQDWDRFRGLEGDDSARGSSYEEGLQELLTRYFGGRYDILTNCSVMDENMSCFDKFGDNAENEVDVVALFQHSTPRIIITEREIKWIPLEGVAFLCEVKSRIDKGRLENDLQKLKILRDIEKVPEDRISTKIGGEQTVDHQIHCLVYDKSSISDSTLNTSLTDSDEWDLVLLVEDDILIINKTIPAIETIPSMVFESKFNTDNQDEELTFEEIGIIENNTDCISISNGLSWFILILSGTIPMPLDTLTTKTFSGLVKKSISGVKVGASKSVSDEDLSLIGENIEIVQDEE